jgi:ubiquinone/menaquinone biosynthesis C-methylase UbiE
MHPAVAVATEPSAEADGKPLEAEPLNLYQFPVLYDTLKTPDAPDIELVRRVFQRHVGSGPWRLLDPACGPGNWLKPFADGRNTIVGNDYCDEMVQWVHGTLRQRRVRAQHGDMYRLDFGTERFDIVLEASGVTSIVPDAARLASWIDDLARWLSPRGAMVFLVNCESPVPQRLPALLWRTPWKLIPGGGKARLQYELLEDLPERGTQRIRRTVSTQNVRNCPAQIQEHYELKVWRKHEVEQVISSLQRVRLASVIDPEHPRALDQPAPEWQGERFFVFKPLA